MAVKLRDKAYQHFTSKLLEKEIVPGQFISQRELVNLTGVPLAAIRELIPRLEADGLITTIPQRGLQVAHIDIDLVKNTFQLRSLLEMEAAGFFTRHAAAETIQALIDAHEDICRRAEDGIDQELVCDAQAVDWNMHDQFIDFLGNEIISSIYRVNSIKIRLISQRSTRLGPSNVTTIMAEHLRILRAMQERDIDAAREKLFAHIEGARNRAMTA